ncbi:uncharacterized protein LOC131638284 [Vicia villosa]|uniref:uncharacterized protein LOC131638284 n=1 Tax=Vicia villosa TaxID=3911 RepID=UPI00273B1A93|nr:uncharacterized protein LOC131638284 [Vicia villosa]
MVDSVDPFVQAQHDDLGEMLSEVKLSRDSEDSHNWKMTEEGTFTVKSCFGSISAELNVGDMVDEAILKALNFLWKTKAPAKLSFFGWRVILNRIATKDQLIKRNVVLDSNDNLCVFCHLHDETISHLFGSCSFMENIWNSVCKWLGDDMVLSVEDFKAYFYHAENIIQVVKRNILGVVWLVTIWSAWLVRNNCIFNLITPSFDNCMSTIVFRM